MTKVQKFNDPEDLKPRYFNILSYQHITNGITYYPWKNMFHIQSSLPVKDLCYVDQIALHMSSCKKWEKIKQEQRIPWKLRFASHCGIWSGTCCFTSNWRFPTMLVLWERKMGEWNRRQATRNLRLLRTKILLTQRSWTMSYTIQRVLKTALEGCSCKNVKINLLHWLLQKFCLWHLLATPTWQAQEVCGSSRQKILSLLETEGCGDFCITHRRTTALWGKV